MQDRPEQMSLRREEQIKRLLESALERDPAERAAFIAEACADDPDLLRVVESLVARHEREGVEESVAGPRVAAAAAPTSATPRTEADTEIVPGSTMLGPYRVLEKLGEGGMGAVYLAKDVRLGRRVALKFLPVHFASDDERVRRFVQEARAASALNHPNIITVHEISEGAGRHFIATEFVEGQTLRERVADGPLAAQEALDICAQVAGALAKAHQGGIIHRDIKPENVMVDAEGHVKVLDFGIAKQFASPAQGETQSPAVARLVDTAPGMVLGTANYMSPEQVRGLELDARTDVWSLGVVLYEMVSGAVPFDAPTYGDIVVSILRDDPPPLARVGVPEELERIVTRALAKRKEARYQTAKEMQAELRRLKLQLEFGAER